MKNIIKKELAALIFGVACFSLIALLAFFNIFSNFQLKFADNLYTPKKVSDDIVIVRIDDKSLDDKTGLGHFSTWTRDYYATVIDNINMHDPKVIAIDISFESLKDEKGDALLVGALSKVQNPILVFRVLEMYFKNGLFLNIDSIKPLKILEEIDNVDISVNNTTVDFDEVVRRVLPGVFDENEQELYDSFSFSTAKKYLGSEKLDVPLEKGQMLINYFSDISDENNRDAFYKWISFSKVFKGSYGEDPEELFKDKIVLIGPASLYFNDLYLTPIDSDSLMDGIEIHANAIQTILEQKFLRNETLLEKLLVLLILCLASSFMFMFTRIRWSVLFLVLAGTGYYLAAPFMFERGVILDLIYPYLALVLVFISVYMYRYMTEFKDKMALKGAFSKYVSANVVDEISKDPSKLKLGGDRREVSILFTDIAHFTSISENLKPESLVALLNEYLGVMSDIIMKEGGTLDKFEGDAIMAFFGAPLHQEDHAVRACNTILKMRKEMALLNKKWESDAPLPGGEKKPQFDFRCGINSGDVIVGNLGSKDRFDYTVMGDAVNLASRLEGANKQYETHIMISAQTFAVVKDSFVARELDIIKVVGKDEPIKVYELLGKSEDLGEAGQTLLKLYSEGISLYHERKFEDGLNKFDEILKQFPDDGPSKLYRQRCEVLRNFPPPEDWDGVFKMRSK